MDKVKNIVFCIRVMNDLFDSVRPIHWFAGFLAAVTGIIHIYLGLMFPLSLLSVSFIVAGLGFFAGTVLVLMDFHRLHLYLAGMPFTLGQIILWYYMNQPDLMLILRGQPLVESLDKLAQFLLVLVLAYLYLDER